MIKTFYKLFGKTDISSKDANVFFDVFLGDKKNKRISVLKDIAHKSNKDQRSLVKSYEKKLSSIR